MRALPAILCLLAALPRGAAPPLRIIAVERPGLPPYEGPDRLYRLEGEGVDHLRPGDRIALRRGLQPLRIGRLEVVSLQLGFAMARRYAPDADAAFPIIGDTAGRLVAHPLPPVPALEEPDESLDLDPASPRALSAADLPSLECLFYLPGDAELSPAGREKLRAWTRSWGTEATWTLLVPRDPKVPQALAHQRSESLRQLLTEAGVATIDIQTVPPPARGAYDVMYVTRR